MLESVAKLGIMGFVALLVVVVVTGLAVYGFVYRPDHDLTKQFATILIGGAGGVLVAAGRFFGGNNDGS